MFATYKTDLYDHSVPVKAMADGIIENEGIVFDVKTTDNAMEFSKKVRAFRYDIQQVHYTFIAECNKVRVQKFPFIVIENEAPFATIVCRLDEERIVDTWAEWQEAMNFYTFCHQKQDFNIGYSEGEVTISKF